MKSMSSTSHYPSCVIFGRIRATKVKKDERRKNEILDREVEVS